MFWDLRVIFPISGDILFPLKIRDMSYGRNGKQLVNNVPVDYRSLFYIDLILK